MEVLQEIECMILGLGFFGLGYYLRSAGLEIALGNLAGRSTGGGGRRDDGGAEVMRGHHQSHAVGTPVS